MELKIKQVNGQYYITIDGKNRYGPYATIDIAEEELDKMQKDNNLHEDIDRSYCPACDQVTVDQGTRCAVCGGDKAKMNMHEPKSVKCSRGAQRYGSKNNSVAEKIMQIDGKILDKYNLRSGVDLKKHEDEFLQAVRSAGISSISQEDADELEDQNYHTALEILMEKGFLKRRKANGYSTTARDKQYIMALTVGWDVTEASDASYFGNKKWFADFVSGEVGVDRNIVHVNLGTKGFVTLEPRR